MTDKSLKIHIILAYSTKFIENCADQAFMKSPNFMVIISFGAVLFFAAKVLMSFLA